MSMIAEGRGTGYPLLAFTLSFGEKLHSLVWKSMDVRFCEEAFDVLAWYLCQRYPFATMG